MTISIDDETAEWARILAAKNHTSVSRLVGEMLAERRRQEEEYRSAVGEYLAGTARPLLDPAGREGYPSRETIHQR
jgi:predicted transcriptional regulator